MGYRGGYTYIIWDPLLAHAQLFPIENPVNCLYNDHLYRALFHALGKLQTYNKELLERGN